MKYWTKPIGMSIKAYRRLRSCSIKKSFKYIGQARREAYKRNQEIYICGYCRNYHLKSKEVL